MLTPSEHSSSVCSAGYLAHKKTPPPQGHYRTLGIVLLQGPTQKVILMSEVPLYGSYHQDASLLDPFPSWWWGCPQGWNRKSPLPNTTLEATQGQMDGFFGQLPYKCRLEEVASVGD